MTDTATMESAVEQAIQAYLDAHATWAAALKEEMELENGRHFIKRVIVGRYIGTDNPETGKPHSASSAEKAAEVDAEYGAYLAKQTDAVVAKNTAYGLMKAAEYRVQLAIAIANQGLA